MELPVPRLGLDILQRWVRILTTILAMVFAAGPAAGAQGIPDPLNPWIPWVLHGYENRLCTPVGQDVGTVCVWPEPLELDLSAGGGRFTQNWMTETPAWITLPGDADTWPKNVTLDGSPALVVEKKGRAVIRIETPGAHTVSGEYRWDRMPETLALPPENGVIGRLAVDGTARPFPDVSNGVLHLSRSPADRDPEQDQDRLHLRVFRRITDAIPLHIDTRIEIQASGRSREVVLGWPVPAEQIPVKILSPLPAKLESDGRLRLQLRQGRWVVDMLTRSTGPVNSLAVGPVDGPWPAVEYWSFAAQRHLRRVDILGVPPVDPTQTDIPAQWHALPAYRVTVDDTVVLEEKRRGDPDPAPNQLTLQRTFWLDSDGGGMTVRDSLTGTVSRGWRLEMRPDFTLGRVTLDGKDQLITRRDATGMRGVEVRRGQVAMTAVSRSDTPARFSAVGWDHNVKGLKAALNLPPGWKLLHARGVDSARTWIGQWTLLDLFVVLIVSLAVGRLMGVVRGVLALCTLTLIYHEPTAPTFIWLPLLGCIALIRILPKGTFTRWIRIVKWIGIAYLVATAIPFTIQQIRHGLYPQLELGRWQQPVPLVSHRQKDALPAAMKTVAKAPTLAMDAAQPAAEAWSEEQTAGKQPEYAQDTQARIQSGPGLPQWQWRTIPLTWNGPVDRTLMLDLVLLSPGLNRLVAFLESVLLLLLSFFMLDLPLKGLSVKKFFSAASVGIVAVGWSLASTGDARSADFPQPQLLEELRGRLLEAPRCFPDCIDIDHMAMEIRERTLTLTLTVNALQSFGLPLPAGPAWHLSHVALDGKACPVFGNAGLRLARVPAGRHTLTLTGVVNRPSVQLSLPLKPHAVAFSGHGAWEIEGIRANGVPGDQLQINRIEAPTGKADALEVGTLPPFVRVERILHLDLEWRMETVVHRLSPPGSPVFLDIPLLPGESVTSEQVTVGDNAVRLVMKPEEQRKSWVSALEKQDRITLTAPHTTAWIESWQLDANPVWHVEATGINVTHHQSPGGYWQPRWHPWPGEQVEIRVARPAGAPGATKTIASSHLVVNPGIRSTDMDLTLNIRSTQGDQQEIDVPAGAELLSMRIDGTDQPVRREGGRIPIPLSPKTQEVKLSWRMADGIGTWFRVPAVNLNMESVNSTVEIQLGRRWVWYVSGPVIGPAVLFYSELFIILVAAALLGACRLTPLGIGEWILLGLGLSQSGLAVGGIVVCWFLALRARQTYEPRMGRRTLNLCQILLAAGSLAAFGALLFAVQNGLLGHPDMLIAGNQSNSHLLRWYQDRVADLLPRPAVFSVPLLAYRLVMLSWALWLAFSLLRWLRWGWGCFSAGRLWEKRPPKKRKPEPAADGFVDNRE